MKLLIAAALANLAFAAPGSVCTKAPYKGFLPLSKNCFVASYCSKNFPVAPVTVTPTTTSKTKTVNVAVTTTLSTTLVPTVIVDTTQTVDTTATISQTVTQTNTVTTVFTTSTTTTVSTITSSTTVVTDANGIVYKRDAAATPAPIAARTAAVGIEARAANAHGFSKLARAKVASSAFAAFTKSVNPALKSVLSTGCSCIATPKTFTATATSTLTTIITSTSSTTTTFTSPTTTTATQITVQTLSETDTVTVTTVTTSSTTTTLVTSATATSLVQQNVCGTNFNAPVTGVSLGVRCGQTISGTYTLRSYGTVASFYDCLVVADEDSGSTSFTFQFSTKLCNIYENSGVNNQYVANADFVYSYFYP